MSVATLFGYGIRTDA